MTTFRLPKPSKSHATCAWCRRTFPTITSLLGHVHDHHVALPPASHLGSKVA